MQEKFLINKKKMALLLEIGSINYSPIPTILESVPCLWIELTRPPPSNLNINSKVNIVSTSQNLTSQNLLVDEIVGTRIILKDPAKVNKIVSNLVLGRATPSSIFLKYVPHNPTYKQRYNQGKLLTEDYYRSNGNDSVFQYF